MFFHKSHYFTRIGFLTFYTVNNKFANRQIKIK